MNDNTKTFSLRINEKLLEKAKKLATDKGINLGGYIRMLLIEKVKESEKEEKEKTE